MNWYIYITCNHKKEGIHIGYCRDIVKCIAFYKQLPTLFFAPERQNILIHLETAENEVDAVNRFREISVMDAGQKMQIIIEQNPDFIELIPNIHFDV